MVGFAVRWAVFVMASAAGVLAAASGSGSPIEVSQKGQAFRPDHLSIGQGDTVRLMNDDGDLLHHSYVESPEFSFDSGDEAPGTRVDVTFPVKGTFTVLCGIHPRMKLMVRVQ